MASSATARASAGPLVVDGTRAMVVGGLAVGAALGFGGNFVEQGSTQNVMYAISGVGLILASVLLAVQHLSAGRMLAAAGFVLLALGETRVLNPTGVAGTEASFAVGVLLYAPALLLIALSSWPALWVRVAGAVAAIPFAAHGLVHLGGGDVDSTGALAGIGYALLTVTVIGWILTVLRADKAETS